MIFLIIIGTILYFVLPIVFVIIILDKFNIDFDVQLVGWGMFIIELAFFMQILYWTQGINVL